MTTLKVEGVYPMAFESEKDVARHLHYAEQGARPLRGAPTRSRCVRYDGGRATGRAPRVSCPRGAFRATVMAKSTKARARVPAKRKAPAKRPRGRPTKLTKPVADRIAEGIALGLSYKDAAMAGGVHEDTLAAYMFFKRFGKQFRTVGEYYAVQILVTVWVRRRLEVVA